MKTQNLVLLTGYVASEPSEKVFDNGTKCVNVALKTRDFYGPSGDKKVDKNFHNLIMWNGISEMATTILKKGDILQITGRLKNKKVEDAESGKTYFKTEIVVTDWSKIADGEAEEDKE